jgi:hypothetical protein
MELKRQMNKIRAAWTGGDGCGWRVRCPQCGKCLACYPHVH